MVCGAVTVAAPDAQLPAEAATDIDYVRSTFRPMDEAMRPLVEDGLLPQATYVLPDGTPMVPPDHADLLVDAGGDPAAVGEHFRERFLAAGGAPELAQEEYAAWLSGGYGACLRATTPEAIVTKDALMTAITALLARPSPTAPGWRTALRAAVDALDAIERPFAEHDRTRFGGPTSRDRLITATRERFPELWAAAEVTCA
jgi:hypothetical protein